MKTRKIVILSNHALRTFTVIVDGKAVHTSEPFTNFETMRDAQVFAKAVALDFVAPNQRTEVKYEYISNNLKTE